MQHLSKLLEIENSELAKGLRFGLRGLRASLRETLKEETNSDDPGASACRELLRELDLLLETTYRQTRGANSHDSLLFRR